MNFVVKLYNGDITYIYGVEKYRLDKLDESKFLDGYADIQKTLEKKISVDHIVYMEELG